MKTEYPNHLSDLFKASELLSFKDFLNAIIEYGRSRLGCEGGSVFLFNGATEILELAAHSYPTPTTEPFFLAPDDGIAGHAFKERVPVVVSGQELTDLYMPLNFLPREQLRTVVAMPVSVFNQPVAVFSFDFTAIHQQSPMLTDAHGLTTEEKGSVEDLWKEFNSPETGMSFHNKRVLQMQNDLNAAGQAPLELKKELGSFVSGLRQAFDDSDWDNPNLICVQLVDRPQKTIRTIRGFGMPLSFDFLPAHSMDSKDIQADIVKNRQVEIIVGNDKERFDQRVFKQYEHDKYVRLWFPFFPFHRSPPIVSGKYGDVEMALKDILIWKDPETRDGMSHWVAEWRKEARPPQGLVFGTVEIGYLRTETDRLSLDQWSKDLVFWSMAKSFELSTGLFNATLSGALERIGCLLASVTHGDTIRFTSTFRKIQEVRTYPTSPPWHAAVPEIIESSKSTPALSKDFRVLEFEPVILEYLGSKENPNSLSTNFPSDYVQSLLKFTGSAAGKAVEVALHLYNAAFYPQELLVPDDDSSYMGTLVNDDVVLSVCEEAAKMTGAIGSAAYFFSKKPFPGENLGKDGLWWIRPPTTWGKKCGEETFWEEIKALARKVVPEKTPQYDKAAPISCQGYKLTFLPLELSNTITGVLVLVFSQGEKFSEPDKRDLERLVPRWVYRTHMNQLILRNHFSARMTELRKEIAEAREEAEATQTDSNCVSVFIKDVLKRTVECQDVLVGWLTLYSESATGPNRLERFWYLKEDEHAHSHIFENASFLYLCSEACEGNRPIIYSGQKKKKEIRKLLDELEEEANKQEEKGETDRAEQLRRFLLYFRAEEEASTILTFPVHKKGDFKGAYSIILSDEHYYDRVHRRLLTELGDLLAETLNKVRNLDQRRIEKKYDQCLDDLRREFVEAENVDDVFGALLRRLGPGTKRPPQNRTATLGLADDIVIWSLSTDSTELAIRSARGKGLEVFEYTDSWIPLKKHPLLDKEKKHIEWFTEKGDPPQLKKSDPSLWTISLNEAAKGETGNIFRSYASKTGRKWLVTFPVVDAADRIYGVIDCLRDEPLPVEEEKVLRRLLRRISIQFHSAVTNCHFKMLGQITKDLFEGTEKELKMFRTQKVYGKLVQHMRRVFNSEHCDLFLDHHGKILLHSTTRQHGLMSDEERSRFYVEPDATGKEMLGNCLKTGQAQIRHAKHSPASSKHLSQNLKRILSDDFRFERMVVPLKKMQGSKTRVGMLQLRGPLVPQIDSTNKGSKEKYLKKSLLFTAEDLQLGNDLGLTIQTIVRMAHLVEQQGWLVNELVHSLGHPLQVLRSAVNATIRALRESNEWKQSNGRKMLDEINKGFDLVHEAKEQLAFHARLTQPQGEYFFEQIKINQLVWECCEVMAKIRFGREINIDYSGVQFIDPVPLVRSWMRKALLNLLDNALKYSWTPRSIKVTAREDNKGSIEIEITNWGIGIPKEHQPRIFEPYFRSKAPDAKGQRTGTGMGLAIAKEAVEVIHQGKVFLKKSSPWRNIMGDSRTSTDQVTDVEHETTFTIVLNREVLNSIAESRSTEETRTNE
jgi:signal transduction histidine kinase